MPFLPIWECSFLQFFEKPIWPITHPSHAQKDYFVYDLMASQECLSILSLLKFRISVFSGCLLDLNLKVEIN